MEDINRTELGRPLPVWQWAVVSSETQVLNSNSKTGVQDPHTLSEFIQPILNGEKNDVKNVACKLGFNP